MKIGDGDWFDPASLAHGSSYILPPQSPTNGRMLDVRAYDNAGNYREAALLFSVVPSAGWRAWVYKSELFLAAWGWFWALLALVLAAGAYFFIYHFVLSHRRLKRELASFEDELRRDLRRIEGRLGEKGSDVDLRPSHMEEKKRALQREAKNLEEKVSEEIKKIEKM